MTSGLLSEMRALLGEADMDLEQLCVCGHPRSEHPSQKMRGVCSVCYAASDHGLEPYCNRFRIPKGHKKAQGTPAAHG